MNMQSMKAGKLYRETTGRVIFVSKSEQVFGDNIEDAMIYFYYLDNPDYVYRVYGKYVNNIVEIQ